jgi:hypothetical protein
VHPALTIEQPATGFHVASVHSICVSAIKALVNWYNLGSLTEVGGLVNRISGG